MMESWMKNLTPELKRRPLNTLCIPGTHDSGAYNLRTDLPLAYDQPFALSSVVRNLSETRAVRKYIKKWAETQSLTILEQLKMGVRYFDIRLELLTDSNAETHLYIVHALYGEKIIDFLTTIKQFLLEHDEEVIIFDINHLHRMSEAEFILNFINPVIQLFGRQSFCSTDNDIARCSINDLVRNNQRLIIISPYNYELEGVIFPSIIVSSIWPKVNSVEGLRKFFKSEMECPNLQHFHVLQGVMTARFSDIAKRPFGNLKTDFSAKSLKTTTNYLKILDCSEIEKLNIVITDQIDEEFVNTVISRNYKKLQE